jgi:hypothetical protein
VLMAAEHQAHPAPHGVPQRFDVGFVSMAARAEARAVPESDPAVPPPPDSADSSQRC